MGNLRLITVSVIDSTTITAKFTSKLDGKIDVANVTITSQTPSAPDSLALRVDVVDDTLTITTQPLTPLAAYYIKFQSADGIKFQSINGDQILYEDGVTNQSLILGPSDPDNVIYEFLINYLRDNVYEKLTDTSSIINNIIQAYSQLLSKALFDIGQIKNENYLSFNVNDEVKTRGAGPFDRLSEEGAYQILRVGRTKTNTSSTLRIDIDSFGKSPISLLATAASEAVTVSSSDGIGKFNINDFSMTVTNFNVSKLTGVTFIYSDATLPFVYNVETLGYQILDSRYDQDFGFSYALLNNNQFKLSTVVLNDPLFSTQNIQSIQVTYEYRNLGRIVNPDTVTTSTVLIASRETLPPIINVFNLKHAPVTDSSGATAVSAGIIFIDPNALTPSTPHPAFLNEIPFRLNALPSLPGQYSVDYATGTVYVYGNDNTNNGTGPFPPLATYKYLFVYKSEIDYVFDSDSNDLVALPNGSLLDNTGSIIFNYEEVLVPDVDYKANLHKENLSERIGNKLLALNTLSTAKGPITNVFRIFNETSGEIYRLVRWFDNKVYFNFTNPPNVLNTVHERASFIDQLNEILFVDTTFTNIYSTKIFRLLLTNNNIIAGTEDSLGSSVNTSVRFSDSTVFLKEKWYDINETFRDNINRISIGEYQVDYANGIVYCAVSNTQDISIGTVSYKISSVLPENIHVISVDDIYYRVSLENPKDKTFTPRAFGDGFITPDSFDVSDEALLNNNIGAAYQSFNNTVGAFVDAVFIPTVTNNIKSIRGLYEFTDLQNSTSPINFAEAATFSNKTIKINPVSLVQYGTVLFDGVNYYINVNISIPFISPNITFNISVIRNSDMAELWDGYGGTIIPGNPVTLVLSGVDSPQLNDSVTIHFSVEINSLSRVIVDYNKGDYYIDYTYLADEIIISYEYGENHLDFRQSLSIPFNTEYFVSYKVGALRDALQKNFGSLINIPELSNFDVDFERERYRDALSAALESFIQGPTVTAIKNICNRISHIEPEIIESAFQNWSLGSSLLTPRSIQTTGQFSLVPSKYGLGVLVNEPDQTISFPTSSNVRIEKGTFETWITPEWNGIDNDAELTFSITEDGYTVPSNLIFVGAAEQHPNYIDNKFTISKNDEIVGTPNKNKDGVFIYYDKDPSRLFNRWYVDVIDGYSDGYDDGYAAGYTIKITTNGLFYDVKSTSNPKPNNVRVASGTGTVTFSIFGSDPIDEGITFIADVEHYLFDFGEEKNKNRLSLFKDPSGYFNFKVYDKLKTSYSISADVSGWRAGDLHHVAASWTLNTRNNRDELHLFIDGFEVPNIIRYGTKVFPYLHEKYRTINPEEIAGQILDNIVGSVDLVTTFGLNTVTSSINFTAYGIVPGGILYIEEVGFDPNGYLITNVNGNTLTLSFTMPLSITNGKFSVNKQTFIMSTEIDVYPNIAVSTITSILDGTDLDVVLPNEVTSTLTNFQTSGVKPGYLLRVDNILFEKHYVILDVSGHNLIVNADNLPPASGQTFHVYPNEEVEIPGPRALRPDYIVGVDANFNPLLTITNGVVANDLVLVKTLGINHKKTRKKFYQWGDTSNVIMTALPPPISLNQVDIYHLLLTGTIINSSNSTAGAGTFTSNNITTIDQPSVSDDGRTLRVTISAASNIDFSSPVLVQINGVVAGITMTETLSFSAPGSMVTTNRFQNIFYVNAAGNYITITKTFLTIAVQEDKSILVPENSLTYPILRYSYQVRSGTTLSGSGTTITDLNGFFSSRDIGNYAIINSPGPAAGTFQILSVSNDHLSATIDTSLPSFSGGFYQIINTSAFRGGFQNGFFILEEDGYANIPYPIQQGLYEFDYYSYLSIKFDSINEDAFIGSDCFGNNQINGIVDETKITAAMLSDTRIGETIQTNEESITKNFNSLKALRKKSDTLMLCHYEEFPFVNDTDFYLVRENKEFIQSGVSVNANFSKSVFIGNKPIIIDNDGILNTRKEGTIEFWANPQFDTSNDPNFRFYFDASATVIERVVSTSEVSVKIAGRASKIISVKLQNGDEKIDYFVGGRLETDTTGAVVEESLSLTASSVTATRPILQVISVKIANDPMHTDYFANGTVGTDKKTIFLGTQLPSNSLSLIITYKPADGADRNLNNQIIRLNRALPNSQTKVVVTYVPTGSQGDRMSLFTDPSGYFNFNITAGGTDFLIRAPALWSRNTWHRVKATYKCNTGTGEDTMRLFLDGYEYGNILFGTGLIFGTGVVFGSAFVGANGITSTIPFKDLINELYIGSEFTKSHTTYALIDNLRISNLSRPVFKPFGESIDVNYNSNLDVVFPVTEDLYTTLLLDFETLLTRNTDFVTLQNKKTGRFDFSVNVLDSFGIINESSKVQQVLETLIKTLKPANSRVFIKYIR